MADLKQKRDRTIHTYPARELHGVPREPSLLSYIRRGLYAGCTMEEMERRSKRLNGKTNNTRT